MPSTLAHNIPMPHPTHPDDNHSSSKAHPSQVTSIRLLLGGSFDPPHNAHMAMLQHVYQTLYNKVLNKNTIAQPIIPSFLPTARSPLKQHSTPPKRRLAMLQLACNQMNVNNSKQSAFQSIDYKINEFEIWQTPPTYTIETLQALRQQHPNDSLIFILGADSVASLKKWRLGYQLTHFAHLWVIPRDDLQTTTAISTVLPSNMQSQVTDNIAPLSQTTHGSLYIDSKQIMPISSRQIREAIIEGNDEFLKSSLPRSVYSYIIANNLYQ